MQPCPSSICSRVVHLFKIKSNPMLPLSGALPLPYVPARVTRVMVLWLPKGTISRLLVVGLLSIVEALCPPLCLFERS